MSHLGMRAVLALGLLASLALGGSAATAVGPAPLPVLAEKTTITFTGTSAMRLLVPRDVRLDRADVQVSFDGGGAAFLIAGPLDSASCAAGFESQADLPRAQQWCTDVSVVAMQGWVSSPFVLMAPSQALPQGRMDFHVVTDGVLTLTLRVPELVGSTSVQATGKIRGLLRRTPVRCSGSLPSQGCAQGIAGQQFVEVPGNSIVGSASFAQRTNNLAPTDDPSPGTASTGACIYPNFYEPAKSSEPAAHPTGCDADEVGPAPATRSYLINAANPLLTALASLRADVQTTPRAAVYTGFIGHQVEAAAALGQGAGRFDGWSYWINREIECSSGDFASC
jgi:hypothetical protein